MDRDTEIKTYNKTGLKTNDQDSGDWKKLKSLFRVGKKSGRGQLSGADVEPNKYACVCVPAKYPTAEFLAGYEEPCLGAPPTSRVY